jgi:hypothetical protein
MQRENAIRTLGWALAASLSVAIATVAQDQGFEIIYEGVVESGDEGAQAADSARLQLSLYGLAGYSAGGTLWASAGLRAQFAIRGFAVDADVGYGTQGLSAQAGASGELAGFGVAGDVSWTSDSTPSIDLTTWGEIELFRVTANAHLAGANSSFTLSGSTDLSGYGLSATVEVSGGKLAQASLGANLGLGDLSLSGSAGIAGGQINVGGGVGLKLGPVDLVANAGYDGAVGVNATVGANASWQGFEMSAVGLFDDTGLGLELLARLAVKGGEVGFTGRLSGGSLNAEVSGSLSLGSMTADLSIAFDTQNGFAWAEVGLEVPF